MINRLGSMASITLAFILLAAPLARASAPTTFAAPVASSFTTTVAANRQNIVQLQGSDADGTALTYATTSTPAHGTLSNLNTATGALVYTPVANYVGADSFTYTVTSGGDTSAAGTVTLTVTNSKTTISDSIVDASGAGRNGKITFILTQPVTTPTGIAPVGSSVSATVTGGNFSLQVFPSRSLSPAAYYQVWFADNVGAKQELIGIYDIPLSSTAVGLAAYKVLDTNLAARYTFASVAGLEALTSAVSSASLNQLFGQSRTSGRLQYWNGSNLVDSLVRQSSGTVLIDGHISASGSVFTLGNVNATGTVTGGNFVGINNAAVPGTLSGKTITNATIPAPVITGTIGGANRTLSGTTTAESLVTTGLTLNGVPVYTVAQSFNSRTGAVTLQSSDLNGLSGAGLTGIGTGTGGVLNTGSTTLGGDTDEDDTGVVDLQTRNQSRLQITNDGFILQRGPLDGSNLAAVVAAVGSAQRTLRIATPQTISANLSIPLNVTLEFTDTGSITMNGTAVLSIAQGSFPVAPRRQIFFYPAGYRVRATTVAAGGSGYTSAPTVSFTGGGCTTAPTATATLAADAVQTITMTSGGAGCMDAPTVTLSGGGGTGARGVAHLGAAVEFTNAYPENFYPEWWGAVGDGSTGDLAKLDAMLLSMQKSVGGGLPHGGRVSLQGGKIYKVEGTWHIQRDIHLTSAGNRSTLLWPTNVLGMVLHSISTRNGEYLIPNGRAQNSVIENLNIAAEESTATVSTVTLNRWLVTVTGGATFDTSASVQDGNTINIEGHDYLIESVESSTQIRLRNRQPIKLITSGGTASITHTGFQLTSPDWASGRVNLELSGVRRTISAVTPAGPSYRYGALLTTSGAPIPAIGLTAIGSGYTTAPSCAITGGGGAGATCTATINPGTGTVLSVTLTDEGWGYTSAPTITLSGGGGAGATAIIAPLPSATIPAFEGTGYLTGGFAPGIGTKSARFNIYHGVDFRTTAVMRDVTVSGFHGNGVNANSTQGPTYNPGVEPNGNIVQLERVWAEDNSGNGFYFKGVNSNAGNFFGLSANRNAGYGVYDNSFLGNNHYGHHTLSNYLGGYASTIGGNNASNFYGIYAEGDQPANSLGRLSSVFGGTIANGFDTAVETPKFVNFDDSVDRYLIHGQVARRNIGLGPVRLLSSLDTGGSVSGLFTFYVADTTGGAINYVLPLLGAEDIGRVFVFKRRVGANAFTLFTSGGALIDGAASLEVTSTTVRLLYASSGVWVTV